MSRFTARVTVDTSRLNRILKNLPGNTHDYVRAAAFSIEAKAKMNAPVDTGALRNSIYTRIGTQVDGGPRAHAEAKSRNPDAALAELPQPPNNTTAHVGPGVDYAQDVEFGTHRQSAQPYLVPAVQQVTREIESGSLRRAARRIVTDE